MQTKWEAVRSNWKRLFSGLLIILIACSHTGPGDPAKVVEAYLEAKIASEDDTIRRLLCSEMEVHLEREQRTFESVTGAHTEGMACTASGDASVRCEGNIVALYGTEETVFPLTSYRVVEEDGEWKWCGEAP